MPPSCSPAVPGDVALSSSSPGAAAGNPANQARHRSDSPASTPLTGSLTLVAERIQTVRRGSVLVAVSGGLVAGLGVPATGPLGLASFTEDTRSAGGLAVTDALAGAPSIAADGSIAPAVADVPDAADTPAQDAEIQALLTATVDFDHAAMTPVPAPTGTEPQRRRAQPHVPRTRPDDDPAKAHHPRIPSDRARTAAPQAAAPQTRREARARPAKPATAKPAPATPATPAPAKPAPATPPAARKAEAAAPSSRAVAVGMRYLGVRYRWGGTTPRGFDCSGFTQYVYRQLGKKLGRTVADQRRDVRIVPRSQALPGDLIFFGNYHIAIYLGGNKMIAAPRTGKTVQVQEIYSPNVSFGRV